MAARTMPPDITYQIFPYYNASTLSLLEASRAGDSFTVYSDLAIWDSTANSYVDPSKVKNLVSGNIGLY
jgi:hypothetical protein